MSYSKGDVILLPYPFTNLSGTKVRPAIVVASDKQEKYSDLFVVPLTSKTTSLNEGEFVLSDWQMAGLNVLSTVKRGCLLVEISLVRQKLGTLSKQDSKKIDDSLKGWLELL